MKIEVAYDSQIFRDGCPPKVTETVSKKCWSTRGKWSVYVKEVKKILCSGISQ